MKQIKHSVQGDIVEMIDTERNQQLATKFFSNQEIYNREVRIHQYIREQMQSRAEKKYYSLIQSCNPETRGLSCNMGICNLRQFIQKRAENKICWKEHEILYVLITLIDMVMVLWEIGIYHGDLKPENIILLYKGRRRFKIQLIDFGASTKDPNEIVGYSEQYFFSIFSDYRHLGTDVEAQKLKPRERVLQEFYAVFVIILDILQAQLEVESSQQSEPGGTAKNSLTRCSSHKSHFSEDSLLEESRGTVPADTPLQASLQGEQGRRKQSLALQAQLAYEQFQRLHPVAKNFEKKALGTYIAWYYVYYSQLPEFQPSGVSAQVLQFLDGLYCRTVNIDEMKKRGLVEKFGLNRKKFFIKDVQQIIYHEIYQKKYTILQEEIKKNPAQFWIYLNIAMKAQLTDQYAWIYQYFLKEKDSLVQFSAHAQKPVKYSNINRLCKLLCCMGTEQSLRTALDYLVQWLAACPTLLPDFEVLFADCGSKQEGAPEFGASLTDESPEQLEHLLQHAADDKKDFLVQRYLDVITCPANVKNHGALTFALTKYASKAFYLMGKILSDMGKYSKAVHLLEKNKALIEFAVKHLRLSKKEEKQLDSLLFLNSIQYCNSLCEKICYVGDVNGKKTLERLYLLSQDYQNQHKEMSQIRFSKALIYMKQNKHLKALQEFSQLLEYIKINLHSDHLMKYEVLLQMAYIYHKFHQYEESALVYKKVFFGKKFDIFYQQEKYDKFKYLATINYYKIGNKDGVVDSLMEYFSYIQVKQSDEAFWNDSTNVEFLLKIIDLYITLLTEPEYGDLGIQYITWDTFGPINLLVKIYHKFRKKLHKLFLYLQLRPLARRVVEFIEAQSKNKDRIQKQHCDDQHQFDDQQQQAVLAIIQQNVTRLPELNEQIEYLDGYLNVFTDVKQTISKMSLGSPEGDSIYQDLQSCAQKEIQQDLQILQSIPEGKKYDIRIKWLWLTHLRSSLLYSETKQCWNETKKYLKQAEVIYQYLSENSVLVFYKHDLLKIIDRYQKYLSLIQEKEQIDQIQSAFKAASPTRGMHYPPQGQNLL